MLYTFNYLHIQDAGDTILDFKPQTGDVIDISEVLDDYQPSDPITDYVQLNQVDTNSYELLLNPAGSGEAASSDAPAESSSEKAAPAADSSAQSSDSEKSAGGVVDVEVPDIGEDGEVEVIDVLVSVGDTIE